MITRVYLENWKSHHETELAFSTGVNGIVGEMGSGKSSVLEAICFGLYGTTPALQSRRVTLDDVIRRSPSPANTAVVEVDVQHDGSTYTVRREVERGKGTTTAELREDDELLAAPQASEVTEEVADLLGIDYDLFARAIYSEQNELDYFLILRSGERKQKIDELLNLDRFETARSTLVSVVNRLDRRRENREEDVADLESDIDEEELAELEEQVAEAEDELADLEDEKDEVEEQLEEAREQLEELEEERQTVEELEKKRTALETRLETLDERLDELSDEAGEYADASPGDLVEERQELEDELAELEEQAEEIDEVEAELERLQERKDELAEERQELEEDIERLDRLPAVEEELEEMQEELDEIRSERERVEVRLDDVAETLGQLSGAAEECPTCGQELTEEHRVTVLEDAREEKEELEQRREELADRGDELAEQVEERAEQRDELVQLKGEEDRLGAVESALDEVAESIDEHEARLNELRESYTPDRGEELERRLEQIEAGEEMVELAEEKTKREVELEQLAEQIDETGFDEETLEAVRDRVGELEKRREVLASKQEDRAELLSEREKRLEELQEKLDRLDDYREQVAAYRETVEVMDDLRAGLEATQTELRERFVTSVNEVMDDVWTRIYPYSDYRRIRLNAQEGYALELLEDGNWVPVEGEVSGGERHSAALALRIALSIVLSPAWQVLILDEPTHNLDATAIEDLADSLRTRVSDIVDQLFLITHEQRLETAATGELYRLSRKETGTGLTAVESAAVE